MRRTAARVVLAAACLLAGCARPDDPGARTDRALAAALRALIAAQSPDGAWRSRSYGGLKDGLSLTPPVLKALAFGPIVAGSDEARRKGAAFLIGRTRTAGPIVDEPLNLVYPVYTASASILALGRLDPPGAPEARAAWVAELRRRQLTEALGWGPDDPAYGAWGYALEPPVKLDPPRDELPTAADLSSTLFAVGALRVAGADADDPALRKALVFIERCQNFVERPGDADPAFDDGGFFFTTTDPVRNKAGAAGTDRSGRARFHSYGSATADGLRALLRCGLPTDHPRVSAARRWLERHFAAEVHPGDFEPGREVERDGTYFYYAWSVAHAFRALGVREWSDDGRHVVWAEALAPALLRLQRPDGTWSNPVGASKEDDPLVATPLAAAALALCRASSGPSALLPAPGATP